MYEQPGAFYWVKNQKNKEPTIKPNKQRTKKIKEKWEQHRKMKIRCWELQFWTLPSPFYLPCVWHFLQEHAVNNHRPWVFTIPPGLGCTETFSRRSLHRELLGRSQHLRTGFLCSRMPSCLSLRCVRPSAPPGAFFSALKAAWPSRALETLSALIQARLCSPVQFKHLSQFRNPSNPNMETGMAIPCPDILRVALSSLINHSRQDMTL